MTISSTQPKSIHHTQALQALALMALFVVTPATVMASPSISQEDINSDRILKKLDKSPISPEHGAALTDRDIYNAHIPEHSIVAVFLPVEALSNDKVANYISPVVRDQDSRIALEGFDPVGYFTKGKQIKGNEDYTATHQGSTYHFASPENRDLFLSNTSKYAPAYGGYCTETLASGQLVAGDPSSWTVHGNRLFLTKSKQSTKEFREHRALSVTKANENWGLVENNLGISETGVNESYSDVQ